MYYHLKGQKKTKEKKSVVIIEDNKFMLSLLTNILKGDFNVKTFSNADEAKDWISNNKEVNVILTDINLENSCGISLAKQIKSDDELKNIPLIFLSGLEKKQLEEKTSDIKYEAFINKPFSPDALIDQIRKVA